MNGAVRIFLHGIIVLALMAGNLPAWGTHGAAHAASDAPAQQDSSSDCHSDDSSTPAPPAKDCCVSRQDCPQHDCAICPGLTLHAPAEPSLAGIARPDRAPDSISRELTSLPPEQLLRPPRY
jgi:hypothetical protein